MQQACLKSSAQVCHMMGFGHVEASALAERKRARLRELRMRGAAREMEEEVRRNRERDAEDLYRETLLMERELNADLVMYFTAPYPAPRDSLSLELLRRRLQAERTGGRVTHFTLATLASELGVQGDLAGAEPLCARRWHGQRQRVRG